MRSHQVSGMLDFLKVMDAIGSIHRIVMEMANGNKGRQQIRDDMLRLNMSRFFLVSSFLRNITHAERVFCVVLVRVFCVVFFK